MQILLEGVSVFSGNRGVNALGLGAITILAKKYDIDKIDILAKSKERKLLKKEVKLGEDKRLIVHVHYFNGKDFLRSFIEAYLKKIISYSPTSPLSQLMNKVDVVYNVNEGDSFSDIYGYKRIFYHAIDSWLAFSWKKPIIFLPQTIGPFRTILGKIIAKNILKRLKEVYVRDEKALLFLNELKVPYKLNVDMAVYMEPSLLTDVDLPKEFIGLNINGLMYFNPYSSMKNQYLNYRTLVHKLLQYFIKKNINVLLVPHTYDATNPNEEDDLKAILEIYNNSTEMDKKNLGIISKDYDAQELKYIISQSNFFIGSRMHACIAALSTNIPTIGLAYSYKFEGTFSMFNSKETVINVANINSDEIENLIEEIGKFYNKKDKSKQKLLNNTFDKFNW